MSASALPPPRFTEAELDLLTKTADALSAYLGKPVLAEVSQTDQGAEWVAFGVPLEKDGAEDEQTHIQMGGPNARFLGSLGGLPAGESNVYDCLYLWAIEVTATEGERFVKLDQEGEEAAWSDDLADMLPFAVSDDGLESLDDDDEDEENDEEDDTDDGFPAPEDRPPLRRH